MDKEWEAIRNKVLERANNCCEACGAPNNTKIIRLTHAGKYPTTTVYDWATYWPEKDLWELNGARFLKYEAGLENLKRHMKLAGYESDFKVVRINLRVAYKDHNKLHNALDNLEALCPKHHAIHTADIRGETRARNKLHAWLQLPLPTDNQDVNENGEVEEDLWADILPKELG